MGWFRKRKDLSDAFRKGAEEDREARLTDASRRAKSADLVALPVVNVSALSSFQRGTYNGDKFSGGFGVTQDVTLDYWTLRARSIQLFRTNIYARGIIRRLVTNEINTGLHLEATPQEKILGLADDDLADWSEEVETRFGLWAKTAKICDQEERSSFGLIQVAIRMEALISGDCLVLLRQDQRTRLPRVQLISGSAVETPAHLPRNGNKIVHGVEIDKSRRHVAYWIRQEDGIAKRLPAFGEKSGRRLAWLVYGGDKRIDDVRGTPLLSAVLQSLREIDRYRDSVQRKAAINSIIAGWVQKGEDKPGTRPITGGAIRKGTETAVDTTGTTRSFAVAEHNPGVWVEELQHGETMHAFNAQVSDEKFVDFEKAVLSAVAWHYEIPPEILWLHFSNNYSASQAAINEFKMYLNRVRTEFGHEFCQRVYVEWLLAETLNKKVTAPGLLQAWRDPLQYDTLAAWVDSDWSGQIKPAVDHSRLVRGYAEALKLGVITRARVARELYGLKYSQVIKQLARENSLLADANLSVDPDLPVNVISDNVDDIDRDEDEDEENERTSLHVVAP